MKWYKNDICLAANEANLIVLNQSNCRRCDFSKKKGILKTNTSHNNENVLLLLIVCYNSELNNRCDKMERLNTKRECFSSSGKTTNDQDGKLNVTPQTCKYRCFVITKTQHNGSQSLVQCICIVFT